MRARVSVVAAAVTLVLAGGLASAQRPSAKIVAEAKRLFLEGKTQFEEQRHMEALVNFHGSLTLVNRHSTILFMGHCYRMLSWPDLAHARYQQFLTMVEGNRRLRVGTTVIDDVRNLSEILKATLGQVDEGKRQLERGEVKEALTTFQKALEKTRWAEIQRQIARCHQKLGEPKKALTAVRLASEAYRAHVSGWKSAQPPNNDEIQRALAELKGMQQALEAAAAHGHVGLRGVPDGAAVLVDGARHSTAPLDGPLKLTVGVHRIEVSASGFVTWSKTVDVVSGKEATVAVELRPEPKPLPPPPKRSTAWLATTITMASLALGSEIMAWATWGKSTTLHSTDSSFGTLKTLTLVGHVLAATFALATGASYFMYERSGRVEAPRRGRAAVDGPTCGSPSPSDAVLVHGSFQF